MGGLQFPQFPSRHAGLWNSGIWSPHIFQVAKVEHDGFQPSKDRNVIMAIASGKETGSKSVNDEDALYGWMDNSTGYDW